MATCPRLSTGEAFLSTLLRHIDCQAQTIGADGYQALAAPGSPFALALTGLLGYRPDLVLSGINQGANMGDDTLYSGTVAAAMRSASKRRPVEPPVK